MNQTEQVLKIVEYFYGAHGALNTVAEISRATGVAEQNVRRRLNEMRDYGWVFYTHDPEDNRTVLWALTARAYSEENQGVIKKAEQLIEQAKEMFDRVELFSWMAPTPTQDVVAYQNHTAPPDLPEQMTTIPPDSNITYTYTVRCDTCGMADGPEGETCPNCGSMLTVEEGIGRGWPREKT
jgi:DNA-binding MarR family transcriptional regulator